MTKSIIAIATAVLAAATLMSSAAEAGFKVHFGFGGVPPYLTDYNKQSAYEHSPARKRAYRAARRQEREQAPVKVSKKAVDTETVAKVEEPTPATDTAESENSSISVAQAQAKQETAAEPVKTADASEPQAAHGIDCKKFFATVGMTLTVPCE